MVKDFAVSTKFAIARIALGIACVLLLRKKKFCWIYPSVAGFGCSCSWNSAVGCIAVVVDVAVV